MFFILNHLLFKYTSYKLLYSRAIFSRSNLFSNSSALFANCFCRKASLRSSSISLVSALLFRGARFSFSFSNASDNVCSIESVNAFRTESVDAFSVELDNALFTFECKD